MGGQAHARAGDDGAGRWGHFAPQVLIVAVVTTVGFTLAPLPPRHPAVLVTPLLMVAVVLATWGQMRRHDRSLCEWCVAAMPLNPAEAARTYERRLALAHLGSNRRALVGYLTVLLGADLAVALVPAPLVAATAVAWVGVQSTLIYLVLCHVTHRRLQPWCARCGDGGRRGDDVAAPDPSPVDSNSS